MIGTTYLVTFFLTLNCIVVSQYMELNDPRLGNESFYKMSVIRDYGDKTLDKIRFLKFPRTGVTFATSILRYSCENADSSRPFDLMSKTYIWKHDKTCMKRLLIAGGINAFYTPVPLRYEDSGFVVAMFRNPVERFASQLRWMRSMVGFVRTYGVTEEDVDPLQEQLSAVKTRGSQSAVLNASNPCGKHVKTLNDLRSCRYRVASHFPGLRGCMTKMILGRQCSERYKITIADLQEAKRIVRNEFAFVGITERWDESIRLFHGMHGGKMFSDEMFARYRDSPKAVENVRKALENSYDYFDEEIYDTALEVFERQKKELLIRVRNSGTNLF